MNTTELKDPSVAPIRDIEAGDASLTRGADNSLAWTKVAHELTQAEIDAQADVKGLINPSKVTFGGGGKVGYEELVKVSHDVDVLNSGLVQYEEVEEQSIEPAIISESTNQSLLGFDKNGKAHLDLHPDSVRSISTLNPDKYTVENFNVAGHSSDVVFAVTDDAATPNVLAQLTADGNWNFSNQFNDFGNKKLINRPILYHIICDGQSRSVGYAAVPGITDPSDVNSMILMPEGGVRSKAFNSLTPLSELGSVEQSPSGGIAQSLFDYMGADGVNLEDVNFRFALSNPGDPGSKIEKFIAGGEYESYFYDQVKYAKLAADKMMLDYQIQAFGWIQGGADMAAGTSYQSYYDMLVSMLADREAGVNALLNRNGVKLQMLLTQYDDVKNRPNIDVINAHRDAANNNENIHMVCPLYMISDRPDGLHFSNVHSSWLGHYIALAYQRVVIEGKKWTPLQPTDVSVDGLVVTIEFDVPRAPLEFDTEHLKTIDDQGFIVYDDDGTVAITDISIVRGTAVEITIDRALVVNPRVNYARKYTSTGSGLTGDNPRGLLRDSAGYDNVYKEGEVVLPMHNWCLTFDESIN